MITAIDIEALRGIARGKLTDLAPLTVLTGPNGCGKSTVLDALWIAAGPDPGEAVGRVVRRRPETRDGARWLVGASSPNNTAALTVTTVAPDGAQKTLVYFDPSPGALAIDDRSSGGRPLPEPYRRLQCTRAGGTTRTTFAANNVYAVEQGPNFKGVSAVRYVRFIDPGLVAPVVKIFSEAARQGRRSESYALLADLIPGFQSLDILTEDDGTPALYATLQGAAIPVGLAGDGVQSFIQLALELSALAGGLALIEEPEVYQHPRAIHRSARVLLAAMRRDVQIVLSTHSLELIDAILDAASDADLERVALFNLRLAGGELQASRYAGKDIAFNRDVVANDLR